MPRRKRETRATIKPDAPMTYIDDTGERVSSLAIKPSSIHGKGLFANRDFIKGDHICYYLGEIIDFEEFQRRYGTGLGTYAIKIGKNLYIDAQNTKWHLGRYANQALLKKDNNAKFVTNAKNKTARLVAIKPIKKSSEILVWYGDEYF
jgi:hypothetical protein